MPLVKTVLALVLIQALVATALGEPRRADGIWKAVVPENTNGEFGNEDPMGLIAGARIKTDCSINWVDEKGRRYCFASGTSLVFFLRMPNTNSAKARAFWMKEQAAKPDRLARPSGE